MDKDRREEVMATEVTTDVQKAEAANVASAPEQTRTGPVYSPSVDIFENDNTITLLADMPGVKASDLEIDLRENVLTLTLPKAEQAKPRQIAVRT
jgi:HSP20 family molecular chaperone IbpA